jgi:SAM-dependent methyltransferase
MTVFGREYADAYDSLYAEKDYRGECDLVERVFSAYAVGSVRRILDLGCGTGGHSSLLAERGYDVVGVDRSHEMLDRARRRGGAVRYSQSDIRTVRLGESFDAVLIMFAVLGYLTSNADVRQALCAARQHLRTGGVLFADVWYGPAVLEQRPSERVKVIETGDSGRVIRSASSVLDSRHNVCTVKYQLWRLRDRQLVDEIREEHPMRYFFEPELELMLNAADFELQRVGAFPELEVEPSEQTWNVAFVARAV